MPVCGNYLFFELPKKIVLNPKDGLGLSSALFSISFDGANIVFTSSGSGHGVGMSQYGANGMAKEGNTYREILQHYYAGTAVG